MNGFDYHEIEITKDKPKSTDPLREEFIRIKSGQTEIHLTIEQARWLSWTLHDLVRK